MKGWLRLALVIGVMIALLSAILRSLGGNLRGFWIDIGDTSYRIPAGTDLILTACIGFAAGFLAVLLVGLTVKRVFPWVVTGFRHGNEDK